MTLSPAQRRLGLIGLLFGWCMTLQLSCYFLTGDGLAIGLIWNLLLAVLPIVWGAGFRTAWQARNAIPAISCFLLWLLFLPNAPYILTDLLHLHRRPAVPAWFDLVMLLSCAGTGTIWGYLSLSDVHDVLEQTLGKVVGWMVSGGVLLLCGFGIYVGRYLRWNSWDAFSNPVSLLNSVLRQFSDPGPHPPALPVTFIFGAGLIVGYIVWRGFTTTLPTGAPHPSTS